MSTTQLLASYSRVKGYPGKLYTRAVAVTMDNYQKVVAHLPQVICGYRTLRPSCAKEKQKESEEYEVSASKLQFSM